MLSNPRSIRLHCSFACIQVYKVLSSVIANKAFNVENNALLRHRSIFNNNYNNNNYNNNNYNFINKFLKTNLICNI